MSDIIQLLPENLANQIAAGEVVQRPASVVKELMENAIDAGASAITLIVKDAGKALIQVIDNGSGMSETDARMSFERHATSKIKNLSDLFNIHTMGFRGEALASIAAVAQVELKSRKWGSELGTFIQIEGGRFVEQSPCQYKEGTGISVKNLFYNVPARRNFLKSNAVELNHVIEEFKRIAIAYPNLFFSLYHNELEIYHLKSGNLKQRIVGIFGANYNERLVPVKESTEILSLHGFVGKPEFAKKTRGEQYFFVNNRFIKNNYLNHAVFGNYEDLMPSGTYPFFALFIQINPATIDINVHPTKQEIKFEEDKIVYTYIRSAIKHALGKYTVTPSIDFESDVRLETFERSKPFISEKQAELSSKNILQQRAKSTLKNWEKLFSISQEIETEDYAVLKPGSNIQSASLFAENDEDNNATSFLQLHQKYIISPIKSGFVVIDIQAAHERILYEELLQKMQQEKMATQQQMFPQKINFNPADFSLIEEILSDINHLGFDIQKFGNHTLVVHGLPGNLTDENIEQVLEQILEQYKNNLSVLKLNRKESLARALAKQQALKPGTVLKQEDMRALSNRLFACAHPNKSLDNRPTYVSFNQSDINLKFQQYT